MTKALTTVAIRHIGVQTNAWRARGVKYLITWNFRDMLISRFGESHISRHLIFAILRKFCILTHFNFAFLSKTQFVSLSMLFYMSLKIWLNNLINNVQLNRNAADYVNSNKKDVLTASRRHGMYLPMLECKSRYYWSIDLNIHYIKYSFLLTPRKKMLPFSCTTDVV